MEIEGIDGMEKYPNTFEYVSMGGKREKACVYNVKDVKYMFETNCIVYSTSTGKAVRKTPADMDEEIILRETDILQLRQDGKYDLYRAVKA